MEGILARMKKTLVHMEEKNGSRWILDCMDSGDTVGLGCNGEALHFCTLGIYGRMTDAGLYCKKGSFIEP